MKKVGMPMRMTPKQPRNIHSSSWPACERCCNAVTSQLNRPFEGFDMGNSRSEEGGLQDRPLDERTVGGNKSTAVHPNKYPRILHGCVRGEHSESLVLRAPV